MTAATGPTSRVFAEVPAQAGQPTEPELLAAAYLSRVAEPAAIPLWLLVGEYGYLEAAEAVRRGDVPPEVADCTEARRLSADPQADLAAAERNDIRLILPSSAEWPHYAFAAIHRAGQRRVAEWLTGRRSRPARGELIPPLALWIRGHGELATVGVRSVSLVGSRAASPYGDRLASEFGYGLARQDVVVVSGGAYGIDAAAHRGVLAADGESVLVSAAGLDRPYPPAHRNLYDRTAELGVLVSERPPGSAPHRQRFLSRNRLIAALGGATVVVEAGQRSGALNTAGYARDLGRPVLAVPGPVTSAMSVGCHRLLRRDDHPARLVTSVADILEFCSPAGSVAVGSAERAGSGESSVDLSSGVRRSPDGLDLAAQTVLDGFPSAGSVTEAQLARLSGQPVQAVLSAIPVLLARGLIAGSREGYRLARRPGGRP
jgi:DNA processing protein